MAKRTTSTTITAVILSMVTGRRPGYYEICAITRAACSGHC